MLSCSVTPCHFKLLLLHLSHAELEAAWSEVHPRHHRAHVQGIHGIVFVLRHVQSLLCVPESKIFPAIVDMPVEHGISTITPVPCVEGIVRQDETSSIPKILLLVVLYLHELVSEIVVMEELVVVVSQNQVLLPFEVLEDACGCFHVMNRNVPQDEHVVALLHYPIPVLYDSVVKLLWPVQLVTGEGYLVLRPSYGT